MLQKLSLHNRVGIDVTSGFVSSRWSGRCVFGKIAEELNSFVDTTFQRMIVRVCNLSSWNSNGGNNNACESRHTEHECKRLFGLSVHVRAIGAICSSSSTVCSTATTTSTATATTSTAAATTSTAAATGTSTRASVTSRRMSGWWWFGAYMEPYRSNSKQKESP